RTPLSRIPCHTIAQTSAAYVGAARLYPLLSRVQPGHIMSENKPATRSTGERDSIIVGSSSQGYEVRATPLRITRHVVVFEVYNPYSIVQLSEVLQEFKIIVNDRMIYSGRATVSSLVNTGIVVVCEATLDEESWLDVDLYSLITAPIKLRADFNDFLKEWERIRSISPEYKIVLSDMQNYFVDLRRWLEQVEFGIRSSPVGDSSHLEAEIIQELVPSILPSINALFGRFEEAASNIVPELLPFHRTYAKRQLHPIVLCSPFAYRTYHKPLGYAGDYQMVNMILGNPLEGSSLFAKTVNLWFLSQAPAAAHRNRIKYLTRLLVDETCRCKTQGRPMRIFDLGCGPAAEVQQFLESDEVSDYASFTLLDFNDETLDHADKALRELQAKFSRRTKIELVKKSVHQLLKEEGKPALNQQRYDLIYCAGLFDYLSDRICKRLMNIFYSMLAPGGLLVATNVDISNPSRNTMEYLLEWHLTYRGGKQLEALIPDKASACSAKIDSDETGVNLYLQVRKTDDR
ncbi:MAG TPA: class I SAM-dependent methyltransferase, partial [Candidatus Binatia bacterium]|nr:class I SAM-dependent methyltransferase [Candidatus Binatia bacterium]